MGTLELHHGPLAGRVLRAEDDEGPPALVDAFHNLERDELTHTPVSVMDATPEDLMDRVNWQRRSTRRGGCFKI